MNNNHLLATLYSLIFGLVLAPITYAEQSLPHEVTINDVEFILIPEGWTYRTGGIPETNQKPTFKDELGGGNIKVWVDSFYVAKYEARARHLVPFLNDHKSLSQNYNQRNQSCSITLNKSGDYQLIRPDEDLPATHLSWKIADSWAQDMGFRLLTEAEWERAARGDTKQLWPWGDAWPDETYLGFKTKSICYTWPVDSFAKGQSPFGVYNMAGNIREFVADWYNFESDAQLQDGDRNPLSLEHSPIIEDAPSAEDAGPWKILKGGRWASSPYGARISARIYYTDDNSFRCNGTRFALDTKAVAQYIADNKATITRF